MNKYRYLHWTSAALAVIKMNANDILEQVQGL